MEVGGTNKQKIRAFNAKSNTITELIVIIVIINFYFQKKMSQNVFPIASCEIWICHLVSEIKRITSNINSREHLHFHRKVRKFEI